MNNATQKLLNALSKSMICEKGKVCTNEDGIKYRYDHYKNKYKFTPYWLKLLFEAAAKETTGSFYKTQFHEDNHSFHFARAQYKGQKDREITYSKLIILD